MGAMDLPSFEQEGAWLSAGLRGGDLWVYDLMVEHSKRGRGLGRQTMQSIIDWAATHRLDIRIAVGAEEDGYEYERLVRWYRSLGFVDADPMPEDEHQMVLTFANRTDTMLP